MSNFANHEQSRRERDDFWKWNLQPCIVEFLSNRENQKQWTYCDMLFTAFLKYTMHILYRQDELYMQHLQTWFRALSRDEATIEFRNAFEIMPRVRNAEKILEELEDTRKCNNSRFDLEVFDKAKTCHKKYKLFCLCLSYIVQHENNVLRAHADEWRATVVRDWFDEDNREDAGAFVKRAEMFLQWHGKASLKLCHEELSSFCTAQRTTGRGLLAGTQRNPYIGSAA
jgi:hypothetical protein